MSDPPGSEPDRPRVAALDYGRARIGVAIADDLGFLAHPRPHVGAAPAAKAFRELKRFALEESVTLFLVGLPRNMDGTEGSAARRVRKFADALHEATAITVEFVDERLSTVEAQGRLHAAGKTERSSRAVIDSATAAVLLQGWLDVRRND